MPTQTWERLPAARREAVVAAAEKEFAANGFSGGSLNVIAREAGVAKGSLFQYFDDKVDLFAYLSELASQRIRAVMEDHLVGTDWEAGFFPALERHTTFWVRYFRDNPVDRAMTAAVNLESNAEARTAVLNVVNRHYLEVLRPLLAAAKAQGWLRPDADLDAFLALLLLVYPHLALAPSFSGLDPLLGLGGSGAATADGIHRLVSVFEAAFGSPRRAESTSSDRTRAQARPACRRARSRD